MTLFLCFVFAGSIYGDSLKVNFNDGTWGNLVRRYGPNDNPAQQDTNYTVRIINGEAHLIMPAGAAGTRMTGFLDLPASMVPIAGDLVVEWTFTDVPKLLSLGCNTQFAIAGCYIRGDMNHWAGGLFGDYWGAFANAGGQKLSVLRQGNTNLQSEPFTATQTVSYQIRKIGNNILQLWAKYDSGSWHQVGGNVTITLNPNTAGASYSVAVTHVRVLDLSGKAVDLPADDFIWYGPNIATGIPEDGSSPTGFSLAQNYPNPFNPGTSILFSLPKATAVSLTVYDISGKKIVEVFNGYLEAGDHKIDLDAGKLNLSSGVYLYRLSTDQASSTRKMVLLK